MMFLIGKLQNIGTTVCFTIFILSLAPAPDKKQFIRFWCCSVVTDSDRQNFKQWIRLSGDICALRGALVIGVRGCVCI